MLLASYIIKKPVLPANKMIQQICMVRDLYKTLSDFENAFARDYGISLNEAIQLYTIQKEGKEMTSTAIARQTQMTPSHTSKVLRVLEEKKLIKRTLGQVDRRLMLFKTTELGALRLEALACQQVEIPAIVKALFSLTPPQQSTPDITSWSDR